MAKLQRREMTVDGVKTVVYSAGTGEPVLFFHGAGTVDGFDFLEPWAEKFRAIAPYHPGFGESGDDTTFTDLQDYVMHYLNLLNALNLDKFNLVGLSMGGNLAAIFASQRGHRLKKLALIAPAGIIHPTHPILDIIKIPGDQIPGLLVSKFDVLKKRLPAEITLHFIGDRYREAGTVARLLWEHPANPKFMRHLHRIKTSTMIVWGDEDKIIPVQHTDRWKRHVPHADIRIFKDAGHLVHLEKPEAAEAIAKFLG